MMKLTVNIIIRLVLYAWLSFWFLLRIKMQPPLFDYILIAVIILMSVYFSFHPYDKSLLKIVVNNKTYTIAFFIVLGGIWLQILYEWLSLVPKHTSSSGSYLHYGIILTVMGFPSSIIAEGFRILLNPILGLAYNTWPSIVYVWFTYFIFAFAQFYLIYRWLRKKRGDTETP